MFGTIINKEGYKVEFVHIFDDGSIDSYALKEEEQLIITDWQVANSMLKPKWTGTEWIEIATQEEIEASNPFQLPPEPTEAEVLQEQITTMQGALDFILMYY